MIVFYVMAIVENKIAQFIIEYLRVAKVAIVAYVSMFSYFIAQTVHLYLGNIFSMFSIQIAEWEYIGAMFATITGILAAIYMYYQLSNSRVNLEKSKEDLKKSQVENQILINKNEVAKLEVEKGKLENELHKFMVEYHSYEESAHKQKEFYEKAKELADRYISQLTPETLELKKQIEAEFKKLFPPPTA